MEALESILVSRGTITAGSAIELISIHAHREMGCVQWEAGCVVYIDRDEV